MKQNLLSLLENWTKKRLIVQSKTNRFNNLDQSARRRKNKIILKAKLQSLPINYL